MKTPLVSIIIPTYNRGHLIGETLDSVLAQTYTNWECIVVDDGSTDNTDEVLAVYCNKDVRFQFLQRPDGRPKGANACRNYGFELSKGKYVNWFDSDDLMMPENIEEKLCAFNNNVDFVIGNSINFDEYGQVSRFYIPRYDYPIDANKFVSQEVCWLTIDVLFRKGVLEKIKFDERLKFGQEYNFFSRFLYKNNRGHFLRKDVTKVRIHSDSISSKKNKGNVIKINKEIFWHEEILLNDIYNLASQNIIKRSIRRLIRFSYLGQEKFRLSNNQAIVVKWLIKFKMYKKLVVYILWVLMNLFFGKGYYFIRKIYKYLI